MSFRSPPPHVHSSGRLYLHPLRQRMKLYSGTSKYQPHQGDEEMWRRRQRMKKDAANLQAGPETAQGRVP